MASSPAHLLSIHQWSNVTKYLTTAELCNLRLAGSREVKFQDPSLVSNLALKCDTVPFFTGHSSEGDTDGPVTSTSQRNVPSPISSDGLRRVSPQMREWTASRSHLRINANNSKLCPQRVGHMVSRGYLDSVTNVDMIGVDSRSVELLSRLPRLTSFRVLDCQIKDTDQIEGSGNARTNAAGTADQVAAWAEGEARKVSEDIEDSATSDMSISDMSISRSSSDEYMGGIDDHGNDQQLEHVPLGSTLPQHELAARAQALYVEEGESHVEGLESILRSTSNMRALRHLDVEFDTVVHGSRLIHIRNLTSLRSIRLRGFDLSDGIGHLNMLANLERLQLCHGNYFSSPALNANLEDFVKLSRLRRLTHIHLEGFDDIESLRPFCQEGNLVETLILKHCQDLSPGVMAEVAKMAYLKNFHLVYCEMDSMPILEDADLQHLNSLDLQRLSLFYTMDDVTDLKVLWGLDNLVILNLALDEVDDEVNDYLRTWIVPTFSRLRKLRIFTEGTLDEMMDGLTMGGDERIRDVEVERGRFEFGDVVNLD